tara:strand:- start:8777 stop:9556 length:780 start_codon:yes stop_codon:yes gene_type:complete
MRHTNSIQYDGNKTKKKSIKTKNKSKSKKKSKKIQFKRTLRKRTFKPTLSVNKLVMKGRGQVLPKDTGYHIANFLPMGYDNKNKFSALTLNKEWSKWVVENKDFLNKLDEDQKKPKNREAGLQLIKFLLYTEINESIDFNHSTIVEGSNLLFDWFVKNNNQIDDTDIEEVGKIMISVNSKTPGNSKETINNAYNYWRNIKLKSRDCTVKEFINVFIFSFQTFPLPSEVIEFILEHDDHWIHDISLHMEDEDSESEAETL